MCVFDFKIKKIFKKKSIKLDINSFFFFYIGSIFFIFLFIVYNFFYEILLLTQCHHYEVTFL